MTALSARTYVLGAGGFAVGVSGYVASGLVVSISTGLHTTPAVAGQLTTVFTVVCAVCGPVAAILTSQWERRRLLCSALLVCGLGEALTAAAPTIGLLAAAQALAAMGAATFLATAAEVATSLNRPQQRARAASVVFSGLTVALVAGIPLAAAVAEPLGFRAVFGLTAALCVATTGGIGAIVPTVAAAPPIRLRARIAAAADRPARGVLVVSVVIAASTGVVYTYLAAVLTSTLGASSTMTGLLLAAYGVGGLAGSTLGGRLADRIGPRRAAIVGTGACAAALGSLSLLSQTVLGAALAIAVWGAAYASLHPALASWLVTLAPTRPGLLLPLGSSAIYLGRGCGGLLGGALFTGFGPTVLVAAAAVLAVVAMTATPQSRPSSQSTPRALSALANRGLRVGGGSPP